MWFADNPGIVTLTWRGVEYQVSVMVAIGIVAAVAIVWSIVWGLLRFVLRIPSLMSLAARARRREKGLAAVSRGLIAVNTGDVRAAGKHAADANRLLANEPMAKLLTAQAAQLAGDRERAVAAYNAMLEHPDTHGLGLRGLHVEARRGGDHEAALQYAMRANAHAPAAWAGQAVLDDRTRSGDWAGALATVDTNAGARLIDKPTAQRWRAVHQDGDGGAIEGPRSQSRDGPRLRGLPAVARARSGRRALRAARRRRRRRPARDPDP